MSITMLLTAVYIVPVLSIVIAWAVGYALGRHKGRCPEGYRVAYARFILTYLPKGT